MRVSITIIARLNTHVMVVKMTSMMKLSTLLPSVSHGGVGAVDCK